MPASIQKNGPVRTAEIAVEQTAYHFDKLYTYTIPDTLGGLERGCRVLIPLAGKPAPPGDSHGARRGCGWKKAQAGCLGSG